MYKEEINEAWLVEAQVWVQLHWVLDYEFVEDEEQRKAPEKMCAKEWRFVAPASWNKHEVRQFTMCIIHAAAEFCWTFCKLCYLFEGNVLWL